MKIMGVLVATVLCGAHASAHSKHHPADERWVQSKQAELLQEYAKFLAVPNVASDLPNIRKNAKHISEMMQRRGLSPRFLEGDGANVPPAVFGEWKVPGAKRTLVFYAHYDGQPVTASDWKSGLPFEPLLRSARVDRGGEVLPLPNSGAALDPEWRIYARSASDDKLGVMAILAAVEALKAQGRTPSFNLKLFFEGEEEAGSPNLEAILKKHRHLLGSDGWVIIDGPAHPSGVPQVSLGVRGDVNVEITVHGPLRPLHSGHYGNWAPNPAMMLSHLLASMKDPSGRVLIPGFYDDVVPLSAAEREAIAAVPAADAQLRQELGLGQTEGQGRSLLELVMEPSLNINGIRSADTGERARNVIPSVATATIDLRLVVGNDYLRQVARVIEHIKSQGYTVLDREPTIAERLQNRMIATVVAQKGYNAERTPLEHPLAKAVVAKMKAHGPAVVLPSLGGSLPLYIFRDTLGAPTLSVGLANHDNNQHAEDENLRLGNFLAAIATVTALMQ